MKREAILDAWVEAHARFIVLLVLALGFLVRLWLASGTFFNPDEAMHFLAADQSSLAWAYRASLQTAHPPLLIVLLYFWRHFGTSEWVLRLPSVIAGTAFCWFAFRWFKQILGGTAAWIGLIFVAFLPPMIDLSTEVRQYALLLCFVAASASFLERAFASRSVSSLLSFSIFLYLAMLTHYSALLFAAAAGLYALLRLTRERLPRGWVFVWVVTQILGVALFVVLYKTHIAFWRGSEIEQDMMHGLMRNSYFQWSGGNLALFTLARTFGVFQFVWGQKVVGAVAGLLFCLAIALLLRRRNLLSFPTSPLSGLFLLLVFALNWAAAVLDLYPYGGTRHSALLAMFAIAGVSAAMTWWIQGRLASAILVAGLIVVACHIFATPHRPYMLRADQSKRNMQRAIATLREQLPASATIFTDTQTSYSLWHYLCPERHVVSGTAIPSLGVYECGGKRVIFARSDTLVRSESELLRQYQAMARAADLKPGDSAWVFQAGWDISPARDTAMSVPEFHKGDVQSFGRNIALFKLTVTALPVDRSVVNSSAKSL